MTHKLISYISPNTLYISYFLIKVLLLFEFFKVYIILSHEDDDDKAEMLTHIIYS